MPTPSFILPSAPVYEEGTLYGLELYGSNFVPSPMSFTRATTATRVNSDGLVELVPYNQFTWSQNFDNAAWNKTNCSITANNTTAPDGTITADKLILANGQSGSSSDGTGIRQLVNIASGSYTYSIYAKAAEFTTIRFREIQVTGALLTIDLTNGAISTNAIGAGQYINPTATLVSNGWYRITFQTPTLTALNKYSVRVSETGNGTSGIFIWGYQAVEGTDPLPYLKTETRLNRPRVDFSLPGCPNLLLEPQRTNLVFYSEDFSNAYWTKQAGITATYNTTETLSPDGTYNATKFVGNGTTGVLKTSISVSGVVSRSVYLKSVTGTTTATFKEPNTNVPSPITLTITNEWQRFEMIGDNGSSLQGLQIDDITSDGIYMWGAQLELGSYSTSYIPTTSASVTRNADVASKTGISSLINSEEGVLYAEIKGFISQDTIEPNRYITLTNGTSNERVALLLGGNNNQLRAIIYSSTQSMNLSFTTSLNDVKQFNKLAVKYKSGDYAFFVNGVKIDGSIITNAFPANTLTKLSFDVGDGTQQFRGYAKDVIVYNTALTDDQLEALTGEGFNTYAEMANYYNYITQ
jgi:hypothetical protein